MVSLLVAAKGLLETVGSCPQHEPSGLECSEKRFVVLRQVDRDLAPAFPVSSDPFSCGSSEPEHLVENIDTHHRVGLLCRWITRPQFSTDYAFVGKHCRFDQGTADDPFTKTQVNTEARPQTLRQRHWCRIGQVMLTEQRSTAPLWSSIQPLFSQSVKDITPSLPHRRRCHDAASSMLIHTRIASKWQSGSSA